MYERPTDRQWTRQAFLVKGDQLTPWDKDLRTRTTASFKFTDTSPGGMFCVNPLPQWNTNTDLPVKGRFAKSPGLGRVYSEVFDDYAQMIHMRFGVAEYNSLTRFFGGFYNSTAGYVARTGRSTGALYTIGKAVGMIIPIIAWPLLMASMIGQVISFATSKPRSKYYYLKPAMPLYWNAVQTMVNHIAVNKKIVPRVFSSDQEQAAQVAKWDVSNNKVLADALPDIFDEKGGINVYALANRAQRLARQQQKLEAAHLDSPSITDLPRRLAMTLTETLVDPGSSFYNYMEKWAGSSKGKRDETEKDNAGTVETLEKGDYASMLDFLTSELDDGSQFVSFRVNSTGAVQESFSSSVTESEIQSKMNSMSAGSKSTAFNFMNGNISDGAIGTGIGAIMGGVSNLVAGIGEGFGVSGIAMLGGAAFVDIPKRWQSSAANLPRMNYSVRLISAYGNPLSQLVNIYIPLAMLLAAALPISTGRQSYTSPFLCEVYDKGRCQTRLGIIDSLSVSRGVGNLSFNEDGEPLAIDVSWSVLDLSSILHMPIVEGFSFDPMKSLFDEDSYFNDYMAVLGSMGLKDQIYSWPKFKNNLTQKMADFRTYASWANFASFLGTGTSIGRLASVAYRGTAR